MNVELIENKQEELWLLFCSQDGQHGEKLQGCLNEISTHPEYFLQESIRKDKSRWKKWCKQVIERFTRDYRDWRGQTPLHLLVRCGEPNMLKIYVTWAMNTMISIHSMRSLEERRGGRGGERDNVMILEFMDDFINARDFESGWTALHYVFYYGKYIFLNVLLSYGADRHIRDFDHMMPEELCYSCYEPSSTRKFSSINSDRYKDYHYHDYYTKPKGHDDSTLSVISEIYSWGLNENMTLGHGSPDDRQLPERIDSFCRYADRRYHVVMVSSSKFHTLFLEDHGRVFSSGQGGGGRLGHGDEQAVLTPRLINYFVGKRIPVKAVVAARNHSLFLGENGLVYSCGSATYGKLGYYVSSTVPHSSDCQLEPQPIALYRKLDYHATGIAAFDIYSTIAIGRHLVVFGRNIGQLGLPKGDHDDDSIYRPVISKTFDDDIQQIACCSEAMACLLANTEVMVLSHYTMRKIPFELRRYPYMIPTIPSRGTWRLDANASYFAAINLQAGDVYIWKNIEKPCLVQLPSIVGRVYDIAFSYDVLFIVGSDGGRIRKILLDEGGGGPLINARKEVQLVPGISHVARIYAGEGNSLFAMKLGPMMALQEQQEKDYDRSVVTAAAAAESRGSPLVEDLHVTILLADGTSTFSIKALRSKSRFFRVLLDESSPWCSYMKPPKHIDLSFMPLADFECIMYYVLDETLSIYGKQRGKEEEEEITKGNFYRK
jgi:hypothetical protein